MKRNTVLMVLNIVILAVACQGQELGKTPGAKFSIGGSLGYFAGVSMQANVGVSNFAIGFPLAVRLGLGYSSVEPGNAADARRLFINDATNGTPEESGHVWDLRLDFMYPIKLGSVPKSFIVFGPRHTSFTGTFNYVGGNEKFDVTTSQWGLGGGLESQFPMSPRFRLVINMGIDYLFDASLSGHDTQYKPDGDDVNPREGVSFDDADKAISQPEIEPRVMVGISYAL
jgi:hypothetical protein